MVRNNPATAGTDTNYLNTTAMTTSCSAAPMRPTPSSPASATTPSIGDGGNDVIEGGFGNDILNGGDGDDIINDMAATTTSRPARAMTLSMPARASTSSWARRPGLHLPWHRHGLGSVCRHRQRLHLRQPNAERILGNEGNDWIETGTFDGAPGDNFDEVFAHDDIDGHDVFLGDGGFDEFIGEGGDDIMVGSTGRGKMAGMSGFDWATYKDSTFGINADLSRPIVFDEAPVMPPNAALDEYASMEGLSGSSFNDVLSAPMPWPKSACP